MQVQSTTKTATKEIQEFRQQYYACCKSWPDTLFELTDALLYQNGSAPSLPHLSLAPGFSRSHGSLYKGLSKGELDADRFRQLLVANRPRSWPEVYAIDSSTWMRSDAETSPERGFYYSASHHSNGKPIVAGWSYSWITQLNGQPDSWTAPLDVERIPPKVTLTAATVAQIRRLCHQLPTTGSLPLFVLDAGYDPIALTSQLSGEAVQLLVRLRSDRVFYGDPPERRPGPYGRPRRHGEKCDLGGDPTKLPAPTHSLVDGDPRYGTVQVDAWTGLHAKLAHRGDWLSPGQTPIVKGTILRVQVEHLPKRHGGATNTLWLWWSGLENPDLALLWRGYLRRFDIEHTFRFVKGPLHWTTPRVRTPEQADRWTAVVVAAYTQLRLAKTLVQDHRLPWEKPLTPAQLTPGRVLRGLSALRPQLGSPASVPKRHRAGPGRPRGTKRPPRIRYPAVKKTPWKDV